MSGNDARKALMRTAPRCEFIGVVMPEVVMEGLYVLMGASVKGWGEGVMVGSGQTTILP